MPKIKQSINEIVSFKKQKQNPIIGKLIIYIYLRHIYKTYVIFLAHFHGELSDEFATSLDVCTAENSKNDESLAMLIAVSKTNLYDGVLKKGYPTNKKRTLIAIRKKNSDQVDEWFDLPQLLINILIFLTDQVKLVEANECSLISYHYIDRSKEEVNSTDIKSNISSESARRILFRDFGGKKSMKVLDRKEKMKVNVDIVKEQLDKTLLGEYVFILHNCVKFTLHNLF